MPVDPNDPKAKALREVYKASFWVYTVIIGLAIREVLVDVLPRIFAVFQPSSPSTLGHAPEPALWLAIVRGLVFFVMVTRFHLGGALVLSSLTSDDRVPSRGSGVNVFTGFIHFLLFFAWALSVDSTAQWLGLSLYVWILMAILLFDVLWYPLAPNEEKPLIKPWMYRNVRTAVYVALFLIPIRLCAQGEGPISVLLALSAVVAVSVKELVEIFGRKDPPKKFWTWL